MTTLVSIWNLDKAVALRDSVDRKNRCISAIQSGQSLNVTVRWPDHNSVVDIAQACSVRGLRDRVIALLKEEIGQNKAALRELGFDPDAMPPGTV